MSTLNLKPASAPVKAYYATLQRFARGRFDKEGNIRGAFEDLLNKCARQYGWTLVPEYSIHRKDRHPLSVDGALLDAFNLPRGYWEAKDEKDSLEAEMKKKFEAGYLRSNIPFQRPEQALLPCRMTTPTSKMREAPDFWPSTQQESEKGICP